MAWISVHEKVIGPKLREFYKELGCSCGEALGILNFLWLFGLDNADKYGCILHADRRDLERHIEYSNDGSALAASDAVDALEKTGWLDIVDGQLSIHDWDTWQEQWYKAKERREYDTNRKREERKIKKNRSVLGKSKDVPVENEAEKAQTPHDNPVQSAQVVIEGVEEPKKKVPRAMIAYSDEFERFWTAYPLDKGKGEAFKKFKTRLNDGFSPEELILAAQKYKEQCDRQHTQKVYMKHGRTFLSDALPFLDFCRRSLRLLNRKLLEETHLQDLR